MPFFKHSAVAAFALTAFVLASTAADGPADAKSTLWYDAPASQWMEALPVGNGRLGAMVFGGPSHERLQLNEITVWSGGPQPDANRPDGWIVQRLTANKAGALNFELNLSWPENEQTRFVGPDMLVMTGVTGAHLSFQTHARVLFVGGGRIICKADRLCVEGPTEAVALIAAKTSYGPDYASGYTGADPAVAAVQIQAAAKTFEELRAAPLAEYQPLFGRVRFELGSTSAAATLELVLKPGAGAKPGRTLI